MSPFLEKTLAASRVKELYSRLSTLEEAEFMAAYKKEDEAELTALITQTHKELVAAKKLLAKVW
jgi:hypothetical protein